ncbi:MAG: DUF4157 domain-containing protein [Cyanobacteria bacterium P01_H01_bin.21]
MGEWLQTQVDSKTQASGLSASPRRLQHQRSCNLHQKSGDDNYRISAQSRQSCDSSGDKKALPVLHDLLSSTNLNIQPKLTVGTPNDKYEQEADRLAEQVIRMPQVQLQREPEEESEETVHPKRIPTQVLPGLQRKCAACEEEDKIQLKPKVDALQTTPTLQSRVQRLQQTTGHPLPANVRSFMEPRFGQDFSRVRLHTAGEAPKLAQSLNARAFTVDNNIVFGAGEYQPRTVEGKKLIAHELTHVVQQSKNHSTQRPQLKSQSKEDAEHKHLKKFLKLIKGRLLRRFQKGQKLLITKARSEAAAEILNLNRQGESDFQNIADVEEILIQFRNFGEKTQKGKLTLQRLSTQRTLIDRCSPNNEQAIKASLPVARRLLSQTLKQLNEQADSDFVRNILWLYFRSSSENTLELVKNRLHTVQSRLDDMVFGCTNDKEYKTCEDAVGFYSRSRDRIFLCTEDVQVDLEKSNATDENSRVEEEPDSSSESDEIEEDQPKVKTLDKLALLIIHEAMHFFYPEIIDFGYFGSSCTESFVGRQDKVTAGDPPSERKNNADSYECLVIQLSNPALSGDNAESFKSEIAQRADQFRGVGLTIERSGVSINPGIVNLFHQVSTSLNSFLKLTLPRQADLPLSGH